MSELTEQMRRAASQSPDSPVFAARLVYLLYEAADRIEQLETAEFIGRLPDYVKELEADVERLHGALEWTRQQWVDGEDPMCEDVCEIACKGPCGLGGQL